MEQACLGRKEQSLRFAAGTIAVNGLSGGSSVHIPIPLPYKENRAFTLITDTEVKLIEALKSLIPGLTIRYFVSGSGNIDLRNIKDAAREMGDNR